MVRILIGGDLCPVGRNQPLFEEGNVDALLSDLVPVFRKADWSIANLECPLVAEATPIEKCGPALRVSTQSVLGLKSIGFDAVNLANNHIMDHGKEGLISTLKTLADNNIVSVGAGMNLSEAREIRIQEIQGVRIGVLGLAEHEFSIAGRNMPGANPLDVIDFVRNVDKNRAQFDFLVVLLHGGNEFFQYPRPDLVETCRFLVEQGASAVICQHSHCVGCMEMYMGAPIIYGQGNFLFDMPSHSPTWHEGVLVTLLFGIGEETQVEIVPYIQSADTPGLSEMKGAVKETFNREFKRRCSHLDDKDFLLERWHEFCEKTKRYHLHLLNHPPSHLRRLLGKLDLFHLMDSRQKRMMHLQVLRCESLRAAILTLLENGLKK